MTTSQPSHFGARPALHVEATSISYKPSGTRHRSSQPVAFARRRRSCPLVSQPNYALVETLLRDALDDLRNATILLTKGEMGPPVDESLAQAAECLRELDDLFDRDPLAAHAAGRIFTQLLLERTEAMISLSRAAAGTDLAPEYAAALTRMPDVARKRRREP